MLLRSQKLRVLISDRGKNQFQRVKTLDLSGPGGFPTTCGALTIKDEGQGAKHSPYCLMSGVWCLVYVWFLVFGVRCLAVLAVWCSVFGM